MITNALESNVTLYKVQFDKYMVEKYHNHVVDRLSLDLDALKFRIGYMVRNNKDLDKLPNLRDDFISTATNLREIFSEFLYDFIVQFVGFTDNTNEGDIIDVFSTDMDLTQDIIKLNFTLVSSNSEYLEYVDTTIHANDVFDMYPNQFFRYSTDSYNDAIAKAYPELFENRHVDDIGKGADGDVFVHNFTFQTTEACSLNCTYCYQFNKSPMRMRLDTAKTFIDKLLNDEYGYINRYNSPAIIIEFIGGEPLLEINLTRKIYEYFLDQCYAKNHPWFTMHRLSICSNGLQYFDPAVQKFFKDYSQQISFNISIDGNKELHDACRIQPTGEGSYDVAMTALNHYNRVYSKERNSKMTLAPSNIKYLFESVVDFINHGMTNINLNCVFEEGWTVDTAKTEYEQLKKLAEYILDNDLEHLYIAIFKETPEGPMDKYSDGNHCGGLGSMLAMRPNGQFYPCIRYMPTSVGDDVKDLCIGTVQTGMVGREQDSEVLTMMDAITRRSQSNDICYDCPIGNSCAWCFKAGTLIATSMGMFPIEKITKGMYVQTSDGRLNPVKSVLNRIAASNETICLHAHDIMPIYTTAEHPFWVKQVIGVSDKSFVYGEPAWVNARDIGPHDELLMIDNNWIEVESIQWLNESYEVYNLSVFNDPTYYANGVLVHNCSALSHTVYGTPGKRPMFICIQMIAEALANVYYWNLLAIKHPEYHLVPRKNMIPDQWANIIVDEDELDLLKKIELYAKMEYLENEK